MLQAVAFDLDDTLYPEADFVRGGYRAVGIWTGRKWGVDIYADLVALFEQGQRGDLFTPALRARGIDTAEHDMAALAQVYRAHVPVLRPFAEAPEVLRELRARGLRLGLLSDGWLQVQLRKWRALGLSSWFQAVVFSDTWGRAAWKPAKRPYQELARRLRLTPAAMVYVGDNPRKDFIGARGLGMRTIHVCRPGAVHAGVRADAAHQADLVVNDLRSLLDELKTMT